MTGRPSSPEPVLAPWLVVVQPDGSRQEVRLSLALTTIGRSEQNVVEVLDPKLSRFHCEVERRGAEWLVRDCNSRNGTQLNGAAVDGARPLRHGDRIVIGATTIDFLHQLPDARPPAAPPSAAAPGLGELDTIGPTRLADALRPTTGFDARLTQRIEALGGGARADPWPRLALATRRALDARSRGELIELAVQDAPAFVQARGALLVLGADPATLTVTASLGLERDARGRCVDVARRVLETRGRVADDRRTLGLPLRGRSGLHGGLVLHDLAVAAPEGSAELDALQQLADVVGRTLSTSLQIEDVRRDERAFAAERLAHDLRVVARGPAPPATPGLDVGVAEAAEVGAGRLLLDRFPGPARAGRSEAFVLLGDVPDVDAPAEQPFRRRGERSFPPLLAQTALRGALRALVAFVPRTDELLLHLDGLRGTGPLQRAALLLVRHDPTTGALRFAGAGHAPLLIRRRDAAAVEALAPLGPALGAGPPARGGERELRLEPGDVALALSGAAWRAAGDEAARTVTLGLDPTRPADELAGRALHALARRVGGAPIEDAAAVVIRRT